MCLNLNLFARKHIAKTDIIVYKRLKVITASLNVEVYTTLYQGITIKLGKGYTSNLKSDMEYIFTRTCEIGIHTYTDVNDALYDRNTWEIVVKCIIPKGAEYYKGEFNGSKGFASDKLIYTKEIIKNIGY